MIGIVASMLLQAVAAEAPPPDTAAMIETYRERTSVVDSIEGGCARDDDSTDIVVCGGSDAAMRIPLPDERAPDPNRAYHGEPRLDPGRPCPPTGCTGVNFIQGATFLYRLARKIIDPDS
jgi:hypothetical protein